MKGTEKMTPPPESAIASGRVDASGVNRKTWWRRFGGDGFLISLAIHLALACVAIFWVITTYVDKKNDTDSNVFSSGAGGGNNGETAKIYEHKITPRVARDMVRTPDKIVARGASSIALPEVQAMDMSAFTTGNSRGGISKGNGTGTGGGSGIGAGIGVGGGKNYVGKFVMGARIQARKIAVYLDCSGSMTPYLERVKKEIYSQFPDADIFEHPGVSTVVLDKQIYLGKNYKGPTSHRNGSAASADRQRTDVSKLTPAGKSLFHKYENNFETGSVGAWIDILVREKYDALVIFSDFQDGVRQYREGKVIYADASRLPKNDVKRSNAESEWERVWVNMFKKTDSPKLYLFSIEVSPQKFLQDLVDASGGETKMLPELREEVRRAARKK